MEGTQIIIKDVLPSSSALQSTFHPLAAWPSVPVVCGWLCRVSVVLLTHYTVPLPLTSWSHHCNAALFFIIYFAFYGLAEKMLHQCQHVCKGLPAEFQVLSRAFGDVTASLEGVVLALCQTSH